MPPDEIRRFDGKEVKVDVEWREYMGGVLESGGMRKGWRNEGRRCRREIV
jgi:hypothetical protein